MFFCLVVGFFKKALKVLLLRNDLLALCKGRNSRQNNSGQNKNKRIRIKE